MAALVVAWNGSLGQLCLCSSAINRNRETVKALYLYPIHAGLHLQLLHSFPGLGDAGRAVVGNTVLHGAPVTPNTGTKGDTHIESMNITLNPQSNPPPQAILYHNLLFKRTHFVWGNLFKSSHAPFYLKKGLKRQQLDSSLSFFSQSSCMNTHTSLELHGSPRGSGALHKGTSADMRGFMLLPLDQQFLDQESNLQLCLHMPPAPTRLPALHLHLPNFLHKVCIDAAALILNLLLSVHPSVQGLNPALVSGPLTPSLQNRPSSAATAETWHLTTDVFGNNVHENMEQFHWGGVLLNQITLTVDFPPPLHRFVYLFSSHQADFYCIKRTLWSRCFADGEFIFQSHPSRLWSQFIAFNHTLVGRTLSGLFHLGVPSILKLCLYLWLCLPRFIRMQRC